MTERKLSAEDCLTAADIQAAIDALADTGGRLVLPAMDLTLDRALELHSGVELVGQGDATVLRKSPGRAWPLLTYHNYGMCDVPLTNAEGLKVGMTVSVQDDKCGGFYGTAARITWIDGNWVGLDHGIEADYKAMATPVVTSAHPLIFGHDVREATVRDLTLDGALDDNPHMMNACRGAAVYFLRSDSVEVSGVREHGFNGEGMGFQMCSRMRISNCTFSGNTGNGLHPGAGSTDVLFEDCIAEDNGRSGLFFCVRANHVTVRGCTLARNGECGVSVGIRDTHNLVEECRILDNASPGVLFRIVPRDTAAHSCLFRRCHIAGNAHTAGHGQVTLTSRAHALAFVGNTIAPGDEGVRVGMSADETTRRIMLKDNDLSACDDATHGASFIEGAPNFSCGHEAAKPEHFRHLPARGTGAHIGKA